MAPLVAESVVLVGFHMDNLVLIVAFAGAVLAVVLVPLRDHSLVVIRSGVQIT